MTGAGAPSVALSGRGLHGGRPARVVLSRSARAEVGLTVQGERGVLPFCPVTDAFRSTTLAVGGATLRTVEHLAAALFGLRVSSGVEITVDGDELPLLDGGASEWLLALERVLGGEGARVDVGPCARVVRAAVLTEGDASYTFEPAEDTHVSARVALGDPRYDLTAAWDGTPRAFAEALAPARTFAREEDVMELAERGVASWVPRESVVVLCKDRAALSHGRPFADDEPARHKLTDLLGDLYVRCGVLTGRVHAERPGHARTHAALDRALAEGLIVLVR